MKSGFLFVLKLVYNRITSQELIAEIQIPESRPISHSLTQALCEDSAKAGLESQALTKVPGLPGSLGSQQRETPLSGQLRAEVQFRCLPHSRETTLGFCCELPREEPVSLLIMKALFSTQQSPADDQVKEMSFTDCSVLSLLSLHSCLLLSLEIDVNLVEREEEEGYTFYLLGFTRGVESRYLTSALRHF